MTGSSTTTNDEAAIEAVAAIIRRVDGAHELGAAALAEALVAEGVLPEARVRQQAAAEIELEKVYARNLRQADMLTDLRAVVAAVEAVRDELRQPVGNEFRDVIRARVADDLAAALGAAVTPTPEATTDEVEWRYAALAAKQHYEQSDERLAGVIAVCDDAESMQWADVSHAYGEGVRAMAGWVRTAATAMPDTPRPVVAAAEHPTDEDGR